MSNFNTSFVDGLAARLDEPGHSIGVAAHDRLP
jgi:hypothetical protein